MTIRQIFTVASTVCVVVGVVFFVRGLSTTQHLITNVGAGARQAAQQISTIEQQVTRAETTPGPPEGSTCRPKGGGSGVIVDTGPAASPPNSPECVPQ